MAETAARKYPHPVYLWIAVPFIAMLWVPFFNRVTPELAGIPFFYWYQMLWTVLGALCIVPVYRYRNRRNQ